MLLHEDNGGEWRRWLTAAEVVLPARWNAYFNRLSMAFNAALAGKGIALVSDFLARQYLKAGSLVRPIDLSVPAAKQYYIVAPASRRRELLISRFFDVTVEFSRMADFEHRPPGGLSAPGRGVKRID